MALKPTPPHVTTIGTDHTIVLPHDIPEGATVAVIVLPTTIKIPDETDRQERFAETFTAIRNAMAHEAEQPPLSDAELNALIEKARKSPKA